MKLKIYVLLALTSVRFSAYAGDFEYHGYMRAPSGSNFEGGKSIQLVNPGAAPQADEFRLGNDVAYGEAYFTENFMKRVVPADPFFTANLTFAYAPAMNAQYADTTVTGDFIQFVEAYVKGGNLDDVKMSFWAGKRFYRDLDITMDDFFYFANMSGDGGGVEDIDLGNGTLAVALLQFSDTRTIENASTGNPAKHALDLRWRNIRLSNEDTLHLWGAFAYTSPGTGTLVTNGVAGAQVNYVASTGEVAGFRWRHKLLLGYNDFAAMYGTGVMESLTLDNTAYAIDNSIKNRKRLRLVNNYSTEINNRWAIQFALIREDADSAAYINSKSSWTSIGVRPMFYFSDHFRIQAEAGYSMVRNEAEIDNLGNQLGTRTMARFTLAPEVSFGRNYYSRPVIRFFVTTTAWNSANGDVSNVDSLIGNLNASQHISALNNKSSETQAGFEAEVWF